MQHPRTSPSSCLFWQEPSPEQPAGTNKTLRHFWGTIKVSLRPSHSFQPPQSTQLILQLLLLLPAGMMSPWHCLVPLVSWGPYGIMGSSNHHRMPVASQGPVESLWHKMLLDLWLFG